MLKNYIKIAARHLFKNKALSFINIFGLAMGMAFAILTGLWVQYETSFDAFHKNGDRIAMVMKHVLFNNERSTGVSSPLPLYYELKSNYPEVKRASRVSFTSSHGLVSGTHKFSKEGEYVDTDFLDMFTFPLIEGTRSTALNDPNSIIITQSLSTALFGAEDPIGKAITLDNQYTLHVTGLIKDVPANSTLSFDFLAPYPFLIEHDNFVKYNTTSWGNNFLINMVELQPGVSMETFSRKISQLNMQRDATIKNQTLFLHPLSKWHLRANFEDWKNTGGKIEYVRMFSIIGIFVLIIACINFMNLATARSETRMKEVGIRKTLGSRRIDLILQFLSESLLTTFIAFLLSVLLVKLLLPQLGGLGFEHIRFDLSQGSLLGFAFLLSAVTGLIAGSYPALYLSSFLPVSVLKRLHQPGKGAVSFRKILVVSQFAISIGLIICTVIVFQEIGHVRQRAIGYNPDKLLAINASQDLDKSFDALKLDLLNSGYVESVAKASQPMTATYNIWGDFSWEGKDPHADIAMDAIMTEWDFEKTVGLNIVQGRPFSREYKTDSNAVILNEAALKVIGYQHPIGRTMKSGNRVITIVGICKDVMLSDPFKSIAPLAILFNGSTTNNVNTIFLRLKPAADLTQSLGAVGPIFDRYNPSLPFEYRFTDEEFGKQFTTEIQVGKLASIFAGLAIFISCLGLFGLSMFMAEQRKKEVGIRKVLGASVVHLLGLLSREFVGLVLLACLIASPLALWLMKDWLHQYEYRIDLNWVVFVATGAGAIAIALLTVSIQAIKAAIANPIRSLQTE